MLPASIAGWGRLPRSYGPGLVGTRRKHQLWLAAHKLMRWEHQPAGANPAAEMALTQASKYC